MIRRSRRDVHRSGSYSTAAFMRGVEDALWLPAWADAVEERGERTPRHITRDTADRMPARVRVVARLWASLLVKTNKKSLYQVWLAASQADGREADPEELGYYLTMQGIGHGVGWTDDHASFSVTLPSAEGHAYKSGGRWSFDGYASARLARPMRDARRRLRARR